MRLEARGKHMSTYSLSLDQCRKSLRSYDAEIEELMELVDGSSALTAEGIAEARERLKNLKACLERDIKRQNSGVALTHPEQAVYMPAIMQARADLLVSAASRPSDEWFSNLYGVQITIHHALEQLENWER